ncbi:MAG: leucine-rich repeat domain-containing protein, partial [Promethearchaeota archaeon]
MQCRYLLLDITPSNYSLANRVRSIDEAKDYLNHSQEREISRRELHPETEFWGHCSNLQAWAENDYDSHLLDSKLAFPLLKQLAKLGDPIAKQKIAEQIEVRFREGYIPVIKYLLREAYLSYLTQEQTGTLLLDLIERDNIDLSETLFKGWILRFLNQETVDQLVLYLFTSGMYYKINPNSNIETCFDDIYERLSNSGKSELLNFLNQNGKIQLSKTGITSIPKDFLTIQIRELYLSENSIKELPEWIGEFSELEVLDVSKNKIQAIPESIGNLKRLRIFKCDWNPIKIFPESLRNLRSLEILSLNK